MITKGEINPGREGAQKPSAIIISPTRELAIQISSEAKFFARSKTLTLTMLLQS